MNEPDLENLQRRVRARREELDLTHLEIQQLGGPSTTTMTKIEAGRGPAPRRDVVHRLEDVLGWQRGSVRAILAGGQPQMATAVPGSSRRLAALVDELSGVSDAEVAAAIGTSAGAIATWRTAGLRDLPNADVLRRLAGLLGVADEVTFHAAGVDAGYIIDPSEPDELATGFETGRLAARRRKEA